MSERLIGRLAEDLRPVPRLAVARRLMLGVGMGAAVSAVLIAFALGLRPDMPQAVGEAMFWVKLAYTLAIGGVALWACERLARPASAADRRLPWLLVPALVVTLLAGWQLARAAAPLRMPMVMGRTADVCPWLILAFSLPPLAGLVWAIRGLAPTRLRLTGTIVGLAAGGIGASVYALHCDESTAPFLAVWYSLGVAAAAVLGWLAGPRLLRW